MEDMKGDFTRALARRVTVLEREVAGLLALLDPQDMRNAPPETLVQVQKALQAWQTSKVTPGSWLAGPWQAHATLSGWWQRATLPGVPATIQIYLDRVPVERAVVGKTRMFGKVEGLPTQETALFSVLYGEAALPAMQHLVDLFLQMQGVRLIDDPLAWNNLNK